MGEAVLADVAKKRGLNIKIDSAGTAGLHAGEEPDERCASRVFFNLNLAHYKLDYRTVAVCKKVSTSDSNTFSAVLTNHALEFFQMNSTGYPSTASHVKSRPPTSRISLISLLLTRTIFAIWRESNRPTPRPWCGYGAHILMISLYPTPITVVLCVFLP
jgi:low molecular weight phosphotyrosine protein phosphatase